MNIENRNALVYGYELNEYIIDSVLGSGGFGITYLAYDRHLESYVVIKEYFPTSLVIREEASTVAVNTLSNKAFYEKGLKRFHQEASILARYQHPNIVKIIDIFSKNNTSYFVMEYHKGEDLLKKYEKKKDLYNENELKDMLFQLLSALEVIHNDNIFHRDIKLDNIFIRDDARLLLIDFGAAKVINEEDDMLKHSSMNAQTEIYSAPEQQFSIASMIGPYTDFYALGVVFYKLMSKKFPVSAKIRSAAQTQNDLDPYVSIEERVGDMYSKSLIELVDGVMKMDRKARPQNVKEVGELLLSKKLERVGYALLLPKGYLLNDRYIIKELLDYNHFYSYKYLAKDKDFNTDVIVHEVSIYPFDNREKIILKPLKGKRKEYQHSIKESLNYCIVQQSMNHQGLEKIDHTFELNGTIYFTTKYEKYESINYILEKDFMQKRLLEIILPLLEVFDILHAHNMILGYLTSDNLEVRNDKTLILRDLFSIKPVEFSVEDRELMYIPKPYWSPESFSLRNITSVASDVYSLAAILYFLIIQKQPTEAPLRACALEDGESDPVILALKDKKKEYEDCFLNAIIKALSFKAKDRFQTISEFRDALLGKDVESKKGFFKWL